MADILLTFHCALHDTDMVTKAIRAVSDAPVHSSEQAVRDWNFDDASTAERVAGRLRRSALELIVDEDALETLVHAVGAAARSLPVRWHSVPVSACGRIA